MFRIFAIHITNIRPPNIDRIVRGEGVVGRLMMRVSNDALGRVLVMLNDMVCNHLIVPVHLPDSNKERFPGETDSGGHSLGHL